MAERISSPRPLFKDGEINKGIKRLKMGGTTAGVVLDISRKGISVNGYYEGFSSDTKYACVRDPVEISWQEFEKMKKSVFAEKKSMSKKKTIEPSRTDKPDSEYLESLPIVTINGSKYYIDASEKERRPVKSPEQVFKF